MAVVVSIVPYKFLPPKIGGQKGIALFNEYISQHLRLICVTVDSNENQYAQGYETVGLFSNSKLRYVNPLNIFKLRKLVKEKQATHVLVEHPYLGWLGILLKKLTATKLVVHSHNIEGIRFKTMGKRWWKLLWLYEKFTHRHADYNFFIHEEDRQYAIKYFGLNANKCIVVTYGIERSSVPAAEEVNRAKDFVRKKHNIAAGEKILLFTGSFNYKPNRDAFETIDKTLAPLLQQKNFPFKVLVCGPWLDIHSATHPNVLITGFVDDISLYFMAADVFINPIVEGGGIKTKLVEALGFNTNSVSTLTGSTGVNPGLCNGKLLLSKDNDWDFFADNIVAASKIQSAVLPAYYQHFYWGFSTKKAAEFING